MQCRNSQTQLILWMKLQHIRGTNIQGCYTFSRWEKVFYFVSKKIQFSLWSLLVCSLLFHSFQPIFILNVTGVWANVDTCSVHSSTETAPRASTCILHIAHCTLHTSHCTLHTPHCTLHTPHNRRFNTAPWTWKHFFPAAGAVAPSSRRQAPAL